MDWNNIDLKDAYQRSQNLIENLTFDKLLLEIHCNIRDIDKEAVKRQFETDLAAIIWDARETFNANLENIVKYAQEERSND